MPTTTRNAKTQDYDVFCTLFAQLGTGDEVPSRQRWDDEMVGQCLMAERRGVVVGYVYFQVLADTGYVRHLVSDASARQQGVGRTLMAAVAKVLRERGCAFWRLNVKPHNVAAVTLYESLGLQPSGTSLATRIAWRDVPVSQTPADAECVRDAQCDSALETRFALPRGQLAHARTLPHREVLSLHDGGVPVGVAVFDTAFPGAFPCRVAGPQWLAPLLACMRAVARPGDEHVSVVIEDGPDVEAVLLNAGAEVRMQLVTMQAAL